MEQTNPGNNPQITSEYQVPPSPKFNFWLISTIILFIVLVGVLGYFLGVSRNQNNQKTVDIVSQPSTSTSSPFSKQVEPSPSAPVQDPTANWKTYSNDFYNFQFLYPPAYTVEEDQTGGGFQVLINKGQTDETAIGVSSKNIGNLSIYLDTPSTGEKTLNQNTWLEFYLPKGTLDGGDTKTKPIYALRIVKDNYLYSVRVFGSSLTKEQSQILSTFRFD